MTEEFEKKYNEIKEKVGPIKLVENLITKSKSQDMITRKMAIEELQKIFAQYKQKEREIFVINREVKYPDQFQINKEDFHFYGEDIVAVGGKEREKAAFCITLIVFFIFLLVLWSRGIISATRDDSEPFSESVKN